MTVTEPEINYDPYDYGIDANPYPTWQRLRDEAPVYYNEQYDFYALSRFADVRSASLDVANLRNGRGSVLEMIRHPEMLENARALLFMDPPEHTHHRELVGRVFTPKRVAEMEPRIRDLCVGYLDRFVGSGGFDFVQDFGALLPMMVIGSFLGIPAEDQDTIRLLTDAQLHREEGDTIGDQSVFAILYQYLDAQVALRRYHPRDDFITALVNAELTEDDGTKRPLDPGELQRFIGILAAAGNETVARLLGWAATTLARHPDQRSRLVAEPGLIPNAVEELLRYEAPSPVQARWVENDVTYHDTVIPAGSVALLLTGSAGRDEREYADAERFDAGRKFAHHMSFGYGIHYCLGANLARMEAVIALEETFKRFPEWQVDWDHAEMVHTSTVRGWHQVPITF